MSRFPGGLLKCTMRVGESCASVVHLVMNRSCDARLSSDFLFAVSLRSSFRRKPESSLILVVMRKPLDPGFRRDDELTIAVLIAYAGRNSPAPGMLAIQLLRIKPSA